MAFRSLPENLTHIPYCDGLKFFSDIRTGWPVCFLLWLTRYLTSDKFHLRASARIISQIGKPHQVLYRSPPRCHLIIPLLPAGSGEYLPKRWNADLTNCFQSFRLPWPDLLLRFRDQTSIHTAGDDY